MKGRRSKVISKLRDAIVFVNSAILLFSQTLRCGTAVFTNSAIQMFLLTQCLCCFCFHVASKCIGANRCDISSCRTNLTYTGCWFATIYPLFPRWSSPGLVTARCACGTWSPGRWSTPSSTTARPSSTSGDVPHSWGGVPAHPPQPRVMLVVKLGLASRRCAEPKGNKCCVVFQDSVITFCCVVNFHRKLPTVYIVPVHTSSQKVQNHEPAIALKSRHFIR